MNAEWTTAWEAARWFERQAAGVLQRMKAQPPESGARYLIHVQYQTEEERVISSGPSVSSSIERELRDGLRSGYLFGRHDEPLNDYGRRLVRVILERIADGG